MNLDSNRIKVMEFLKDNFKELDKLKLTEFKMAPGGIIVNDQNNDSMLFWYDIEENKIKWE